MILGSLPRRYARALMSLAVEEKKIKEFGNDLEALGVALLGIPGVLEALADGAIPYAERMKAISGILDKAGISGMLRNFLMLLVEKERIDLLPSISREYNRMRDKELGIVRVDVQSTQTPTQKDLSKIESLLSDRLSKKVVAKGSAASDLIGGVVLKIGETIYDGSIKRQLEKLKERMI